MSMVSCLPDVVVAVPWYQAHDAELPGMHSLRSFAEPGAHGSGSEVPAPVRQPETRAPRFDASLTRRYSSAAHAPRNGLRIPSPLSRLRIPEAAAASV